MAAATDAILSKMPCAHYAVRMHFCSTHRRPHIVYSNAKLRITNRRFFFSSSFCVCSPRGTMCSVYVWFFSLVWLSGMACVFLRLCLKFINVSMWKITCASLCRKNIFCSFILSYIFEPKERKEKKSLWEIRKTPSQTTDFYLSVVATEEIDFTWICSQLIRFWTLYFIPYIVNVKSQICNAHDLITMR